MERSANRFFYPPSPILPLINKSVVSFFFLRPCPFIPSAYLRACGIERTFASLLKQKIKKRKCPVVAGCTRFGWRAGRGGRSARQRKKRTQFLQKSFSKRAVFGCCRKIKKAALGCRTQYHRRVAFHNHNLFKPSEWRPWNRVLFPMLARVCCANQCRSLFFFLLSPVETQRHTLNRAFNQQGGREWMQTKLAQHPAASGGNVQHDIARNIQAPHFYG
jgi:hypothetical protein